ncbi:hypothetical protein K7640_10695 [Micromonospora sp. PLK6-60]|uniref:hypothetical protein n=1 Tax=Micromonospora sp. PLK6-60 TaxID=2873383 RepID=UPI001CA627C1|nr:hypothetical protein [Micromonospora sp. PLK6-60]MBY8872307.1 hypothetical protein [Micromonospora sp. PLK6-60]
MSMQVDPDYLRGYAEQIEADRDGALATLQQFCREHCDNRDGLDGTLWPARAPLEVMVEFTLNMAAGAHAGMSSLAYNLRYSAGLYDRAEQANTATMETVGQRWATVDESWEAHPSSAGGAFTGGAQVSPAPPAFESALGDVEALAHGTIGDINGVIKALTGFDLFSKIMEFAVGDWGRVRYIGEGFGELEHGFRAISRDLAQGMDVLAPHWTSGGHHSGSPAELFEETIRQRWVPGFDALAQGCNAFQQECEALAQSYGYIIGSLVFVTNFYEKKIRRVLALLLSATDWRKYLGTFFRLVKELWDVLVGTAKLIWEQTVMWKEQIEFMCTSLAHMYKIFRGDFEVFQQG